MITSSIWRFTLPLKIRFRLFTRFAFAAHNLQLSCFHLLIYYAEKIPHNQFLLLANSICFVYYTFYRVRLCSLCVLWYLIGMLVVVFSLLYAYNFYIRTCLTCCLLSFARSCNSSTRFRLSAFAFFWYLSTQFHLNSTELYLYVSVSVISLVSSSPQSHLAKWSRPVTPAHLESFELAKISLLLYAVLLMCDHTAICTIHLPM